MTELTDKNAFFALEQTKKRRMFSIGRPFLESIPDFLLILAGLLACSFRSCLPVRLWRRTVT